MSVTVERDLPTQRLVHLGSKEVNEGWILNGPEFHCDKGCRQELYMKRLANPDKSNCLDDDILSPNRTQRMKLQLCLREKNGLKQLTSTQPFTTDPRFTCRPSSDRMAWYRGTQSRTFHGKTCIRWDDDGVPTKFPLESFSNVSSPSVDYMTLKVFSTSLSQHENHCRNPDNHRFGPWCFYKDGDKIDRAPCFYTCVTDIKKLCLAKALFPYYQTPYNLDDAPVAPVDPHLLRNIKDDTLKMKNAFYDLMDVLDVPEVLDSIEQVTPLYSVALTTRHLTHARLLGSAVVTRRKCHQTGLRTLIAGPWTPIKDDSLTFAEDSVPTTGYKKYRDYERIRLLAGRQGVDKPWKPCFTACEDNPITCWPNQTSTNPTKRLLYFGHKVTTREQRLCVKWTEAFSVLYKHNAEHQRKVEEAKKQKKKKKYEPSAEVVMQLFYYEELTKRIGTKKKPGINRFLDAGVRLLHSPICLDLARLIERDKKSVPKNRGLYQQTIIERYNLMYKEGPGCFTWADEKKKYVDYAPCFPQCPCGTPAIRAPFKPYRQMCKNDKTHEYEPCIARRESRVIHIREHDEKLIPIPEADLGHLYTPLVITIVAGIICILMTFYDQILAITGLFSRIR